MTTTYSIGQTLPNGCVITDDDIELLPDGTTVETIIETDESVVNPDGTHPFNVTRIVLAGPNTPAANPRLFWPRLDQLSWITSRI